MALSELAGPWLQKPVKVLILDDGRRIEFDPVELTSHRSPRELTKVVLIMEGGEELMITSRESVHIGLIPALKVTEQVLNAHENYDFWGMVVHGDLRCGKSSFVIRVLSEVYGRCGYDSHVWITEIHQNRPVRKKMLIVWERNWNAWKKWMVFLPKQFTERLDEIAPTKKQQKLLAWDDAGIWLLKYQWAEDFAQEMTKMIQVIGTDFASLILTTPDNDALLKHIRNLPGMYYGSPSKIAGEGEFHRWTRRLKVYKSYRTPDMKKHPKGIFEEHYNVRLPDDVYAEYDNVRRTYNIVLREQLKAAERELTQRGSYQFAQAMRDLLSKMAPMEEQAEKELGSQ